jgi:hypothetical protein
VPPQLALNLDISLVSLATGNLRLGLPVGRPRAANRRQQTDDRQCRHELEQREAATFTELLNHESPSG